MPKPKCVVFFDQFALHLEFPPFFLEQLIIGLVYCLHTILKEDEVMQMRQELQSRANDMEIIANILNGETSSEEFITLLDSYDAKRKNAENNNEQQWFQIIQKFKTVYDKLIQSQTLELQKQNEKYRNLIRSKDEIIKNANDQIKQLKAEASKTSEQEQTAEIAMDAIKRNKAKELLMKRVQYERSNALKVVDNGDSKESKKTVSELLNDAAPSDAMGIIQSMGALQFEFDKRLKRDIYTLNMTNNSILRRFTNKQRQEFMVVLGNCLVDKENDQQIENVKISNMGIDDRLFVLFMDVLLENASDFKVKELWMESNQIGNEGMKKLAQFIELNVESLEVIKLYNNKDSIKSKVLDNLLVSMEKNCFVIKFTFEWRLSQHRDKMNKILRRNQDRKRKLRWAKKNNKK